MMRATARVAMLLALLLGSGAAWARDAASEAAYPLPAAEQGPAKPAPKQPRRRAPKPAAKPAAKPVKAGAAPIGRTGALKHVPLPRVRPLRRLAAAAPAAKPVPLPPKAPAISAPAAASAADAPKDLPEGWRLVTDPATGAVIALPTRLFPQSRDGAHGTLWSSPHGEVQVETFRLPQAELKTLFERMKTEPAIRLVPCGTTVDEIASGRRRVAGQAGRTRRLAGITGEHRELDQRRTDHD